MVPYREYGLLNSSVIIQLMNECKVPDRQRLIEDYKVVFESLPRLEHLAMGYWQHIGVLTHGPAAAEEERIIFVNTVIEMAEILLDDGIFQRAMSQVGAKMEENAIMESILMIEVVQDIKEERDEIT